MFEYGSRHLRDAGAILRLNYASEMRYGMLWTLLARSRHGDPIDLTGYSTRSGRATRTRWPGIAGTRHVATVILNMTGPEQLQVRT